MANTSTSNNSLTEITTKLLAEFRKRIEKRDTGALDFGIDAYLFAKSLGNKELIVQACRALSQFYTDIRSEFANSVQTLEEGIELLDEPGDIENKAELLRLLGLNFDYLGELIKSKQSYDYSIKLLNALPSLTNNGKLTMARSQFNLSIIYGKLELPVLAEECLQVSYEQYKVLNDKSGIARCYISFGVATEEKNGSRLEALEYYRKAAELSKEINDDVSYCVAKGNMAVKLAEEKRFDEAIEAAFDALDKANRSANKRFQLNLHRQLGRCYHLKKDYLNSKKWYQAGEDLFIQLGLTVDYYDLYHYWSEMLFEAGNYKEAYEKLQKSLKQQAEMHEFHKNAAVSHATLRLQIEEGKKEQDLLKRKNAEIEIYAAKLEASNFELKQFAHAASHDMKEPLRMISNYSQLLEKTTNAQCMTVEQHEYLNFIHDGARRIMDVISSMLRLSEINAVVLDEVDMNKVMDETITYMKEEIRQSKPQFKSDKLPVMQTDRYLISHLFQNLIGNSIKYNISNEPVIEIKYIDHEDHHLFEIGDNGIGIAAEYREKVFIIFQRLHARHEFEGNGTGLTVCKKIIDTLNGKIWIEDSHLGGAKVCFTLPK